MGIQVPPPYLPNTIGYIREYLENYSEGNPYAVFKYARQRAVESVRNRAVLEPPDVLAQYVESVRDGVNYRSIQRYFYILRELDLIEFVRSEPSGRGQPKNFYRIVPGKNIWLRPGIQYQLYPWTYYGRRYEIALEEMPIPMGRSPMPHPPRYRPPLRQGQSWVQLTGVPREEEVEVIEPEGEEEEEPRTVDLSDEVSAAHDRLMSYKRPNAAAAAKILDGLEEKGIDVTDARSALEAYTDIDRADYDSAEDYAADRESAWEEFVDAVGEIDASEIEVKE